MGAALPEPLADALALVEPLAEADALALADADADALAGADAVAHGCAGGGRSALFTVTTPGGSALLAAGATTGAGGLGSSRLLHAKGTAPTRASTTRLRAGTFRRMGALIAQRRPPPKLPRVVTLGEARATRKAMARRVLSVAPALVLAACASSSPPSAALVAPAVVGPLVQDRSLALEVAAAPACPVVAIVDPPAKAMRFDAFAAALAEHIDHASPPLDVELGALAAHHALDATAVDLTRDHRRLRALFEATRDGGFFRLRWAITNQEPSSARIWAQWAQAKTGASLATGPASATAECDEISALTAFLAGRVGVERVGLFYPSWNHTIVAWQPPTAKKGTRVLLPTTQVFLGCDDGFDAADFDPKAQAHVWAYGPKDVAPHATVPASTVAFLLGQIDRWVPATSDLLALVRLDRARRLKSSVARCAHQRVVLAGRLERNHTCADEAALAHYWTEELGQPAAPFAEILRALAPE